MRSKILFYLIAVVLLVLGLSAAGLVYAQAPEGQEYTIQPGDRLTEIARKFLGSAGAFPQIVAATNAKAAEDPSFKAITTPDQIAVGQKLWIPAPAGGATAAESGFGGVYTAKLPAASSPGRAITLTLNANSSAELSTDYLNGEAPIVENGAWQDNGDGTATVSLTGRPDGLLYEAPIVLKFKLTGTTLTAVEYDQSLYGSEGLTLQKQVQAAAPALQPEAVVGIYKVMLPGASSPGLDMTLYLNVDNSVRQVSDYLNGEAPIVEVGSWQIEGNQVLVTLTGQVGKPYDQPSTETLTPTNGGLITVPTGEGVGRWTFLPFAALATGEQPVPYDPAEAGQLFTNGLTGYYKGFWPAATCCGQDITLLLGINDMATLTTDYLNGKAPIVQTGVWTTTSDSAVEVTLAGVESPLSLVASNGLLVTAPDETAYGSAGLSLYRFEVIVANTLEVGLTGTVTYLQRIALPPQAVIIVQLVDASLADAPAQVLDEQVITAGGQQPPFKFELSYKPFKIQQNHTYAVQAWIEVDGELRFINTTRYPVLTQGAPEGPLEIIVEPAGPAPASGAGACAAVPVAISQEAPPDRSDYRAYEPGGTPNSSILGASLTVDPQPADAANLWREAILASLGYCTEGYAPQNVTIYLTSPTQTSVLVFTQVVGDDSVAAQEVRVDLAAQADKQWQVEWAGVRWQCARGDNTTNLTKEFCP